MTRFKEDLWFGAEEPVEAKAEAHAARSVAAQVGRIIGAKPFPIAATRLAELTRDVKVPLVRVVDVLETDPALSARLLRLVNSAGYALRTQCTSVAHAAALVGIEKLNQVATTAAILDLYDSATPAAAEVLEHAAVVGALCRYLAVHVGLPPDEMFTCGFLHDIGKLMLLDCEGERYLDVLRLGGEPDVVHVRERELFGYDHAILAGHVLSAWRIPEPVPQVVAWHHQAARAYQDPLIARMVSVVRLSDAISYCVQRQLCQPEIERMARTEAASYLELSELQLDTMWPDLQTLAVKSRAGFRGEEVPEDVQNRGRAVKALTDDAANENQLPPAADPSKAPQHFPCVVCGVPSYANQCPACHGYVCPTHQLGEDEWCYLCVDEYKALELRLPRWAYVVVGTVIALTGIGSILGASAAAAPNLLITFGAPGLLLASLVLVLVVWHRWLRRFWFLRTVSDRTGFAPVVTDEVARGLTSLPPSSHRVINPFDKRSLQPKTVTAARTGVQYYSLPPRAAEAPLTLGADEMLPVDLGSQEEFADLDLDEAHVTSNIVLAAAPTDPFGEAMTPDASPETLAEDSPDPFESTRVDTVAMAAATPPASDALDDPFADAASDDPFGDAASGDPFAAAPNAAEAAPRAPSSPQHEGARAASDPDPFDDPFAEPVAAAAVSAPAATTAGDDDWGIAADDSPDSTPVSAPAAWVPPAAIIANFRHPEAWRRVAEAHGPADGW